MSNANRRTAIPPNPLPAAVGAMMRSNEWKCPNELLFLQSLTEMHSHVDVEP
jgi:hypothetical protein